MEHRVTSFLGCGRDHVGRGARAPGPFAQRVLSATRVSEFPAPCSLTVGTGTDSVLDQETLDILGARASFLVRDYENASQSTLPPISLYIAYFPTQKGRRHDPFTEPLPAGARDGSRLRGRVVQIARPDGSSFPVNRYVVSKKRESGKLVVYWFSGAWPRGGPATTRPNTIWLSDSVRMNRSDGGLGCA